MINLVWILFIIFILVATYSSFINNGLPKGSNIRVNYLTKYLIKKDSSLNKLYHKNNDIKKCLHIKYLAIAYIINIVLCFIYLVTIILSVIFSFISIDLYNIFSIINMIFICVIALYDVYVFIKHECLAYNSDKEYQKLNENEIEKLKENLLKNYDIKL